MLGPQRSATSRRHSQKKKNKDMPIVYIYIHYIQCFFYIFMYIYIYIHHNGKWKYDEIWTWKGLNRWCFRCGDSSGTYNIEKLFEFQEALCYSQGRLDMPKLLDAALLKSSRWYGHPDLHGITQLVYSTASSQQTVLGQG